MGTDDTFVGVLRRRADEEGARVAFTRWADKSRDERQITYAGLDERARAIAASLQANRLAGERVLLLLPPGLEYIAAFLGCLYAGAVAVPCYPPSGASTEASGSTAGRHSRGLTKIQNIAESARPAAVLAQSTAGQRASLLTQAAGGVPLFPVERLARDGEALHWEMPDISASSLAYLQYTSGSTGSPRGVTITHGNLLANLRDIRETFRLDGASVVASWLPPYHDMGLVGGILEPIYCGGRGVQLSPAEFLQRPGRWLEAIDRHRADTSGAPNFAYDLCVRRVPPEQRAALDLSAWTLAFSGAEPIRAETLDRFVDAFAGSGFRRAAFFPCYGLAEGTLAVTTSRRLIGPRVASLDREGFDRNRAVDRLDGDAKAVVGCGTAVASVRVVIVDGGSRETLPPRSIGEIWVQGPSVAGQYWEASEASATTFDARLASAEGRFLRTGDLGFLDRDGELYVVGRTRDLIIIRGTNHHPADLEATVERCHLVIRSGCCAAFGVPTADGEQLVIAAELEPRSGADRDGRHDPPALNAITAALRAAVLEEHDVEPMAILLVPAGSVPKTSSGKIERYTCRDRFLQHTFTVVHEWRAGGRTDPAVRRPPLTTVERAVAAIWTGVLDTGEAHLDDDFFESGGHSLLALELVDRVRLEMGVDLQIRALIDHPTLEALAGWVDQCPPVAAAPALPDATPAARFDPFQLTDVQEAYLFGRSTSFELGGVATQGVAEFDAANIDFLRLGEAVDRLVERHDMLRAIVAPDGRQVVLSKVPRFPLEVRDASAASEPEREQTLSEVRTRLTESMLPADRWPLFEIVACQLDDRRARIFARFDLLIADLYSLRLLWRELGELYANPDVAPPPTALSFRDCVLREAEASSHPDGDQSMRFWQERIPLLPPAPELPYLKPFAAVGTPRFRRRATVLDAEPWARLRARARRAHVTPAAVLLAAFSEVIAAWSRHPRFTLTLTFFNRPRLPGIDRIVGDFTSLLLVGVDTTAPDFGALARSVQDELWDVLAHRQAGGMRALRHLARLHGRTGHAIMPVVFTSAIGQDSDDRTSPWAWAGEMVGGVSSTPQVVLDHQVQEDGDRLLLTWDAVEALFPDGVLDDMFEAYRGRLDWLVAEGTDWAGPRPPLVPARHLRTVAEANQTDAPLRPATLHGLFLAQAAAHPDQLAVIAADGVTLSYAELERRSRAVARWIADRGVHPDQLVAIALRKGWEQVVATLGVLRAGATYLPIDPSLPADRRRYLLESGRTRLALTQTGLDGALEWPPDVERCHVETCDSATDEGPAPDPQDWTRAAYVIFTSGSTGFPKGVVIDHRGAVNTLADLNARFAVGRDDRVLALSALGFDLSVYDIFGMLAAGGTIVLPEPGSERNPEHWADLLARHRVTLWNSVPALFEMLCEQVAGTTFGLPHTLRLAWLSGDWIPVSLPDRARRLRPGLTVISMGGATEASIWSVLHAIDEVDPHRPSIPYGRPMLNQRMHVLDERLQPRPAWVPGDLYIGGLGVAIEYWRDPQRTAASFLCRPPDGERLYRTGDVARWMPDGVLEFLGREDGQVKIGGLRIELGEIEAALRAHADVRHALVLARQMDGSPPGDASAASRRQLMAYVVPADGRPLSDDLLRGWLEQKLPSGMLPRRIFVLPEIPLSANGKVDAARLPSLAPGGPGALEPLGTEEAAVRDIWAEALGMPADAIAPADNFFDVGGTSVALVRVAAAVSQQSGRSIPLLSFFEHPTVTGMARLSASGDADVRSLDVSDRVARRKGRLASRRDTATVRSAEPIR